MAVRVMLWCARCAGLPLPGDAGRRGDTRSAVPASSFRDLGVVLESPAARRYGHLGAADYLFGLSRNSADGDPATSRRVALVAPGRGMHWACTILVI
jgi:hypothetical protein